jgi:hypothetical protein
LNIQVMFSLEEGYFCLTMVRLTDFLSFGLNKKKKQDIYVGIVAITPQVYQIKLNIVIPSLVFIVGVRSLDNHKTSFLMLLSFLSCITNT